MEGKIKKLQKKSATSKKSVVEKQKVKVKVKQSQTTVKAIDQRAKNNEEIRLFFSSMSLDDYPNVEGLRELKAKFPGFFKKIGELAISLQKQYIVELLEQEDLDAFDFIDKFTTAKNKKGLIEADKLDEENTWVSRGKIIAEFFAENFVVESDYDNIEEIMKRFPHTYRRFLKEFNIMPKELKKRYISEFLDQGEMNAGEFLEEFTKEHMDAIRYFIKEGYAV